MSPPRIAVIGARRRHQGLGPFVIREFVAQGAEIAGFVATSAESVDGARESLREVAGVSPAGYLDFEALRAAESPTALAILSPAETHTAYLDAALDAGLPTLCEKPFVWGADDLARDAEARIAAFETRALLLVENCQWPYTLPAYAALHGPVAPAPGRFEMLMQPAAGGLRVLGDSLPHGLSLLQAATRNAPAEIRDPRFEGDRERGPVFAHFRYAGEAFDVDCTVELRPTQERLRRAAFAFDGRWAHREVEPEHYTIVFRDAEGPGDGSRTVPVPDPENLLLRDFVAALVDPSAIDSLPAHATAGGIRQRIRALGTLTRAFADA